MKTTNAGILVLVVIGVVLAGASTYVISEGEQAVVTQFGDPVRALTEAGLNWKIPFIQEVHRLDKRLLPWDGDPQNMPTKDKRLIDIDVWARWRIVDPLKFYTVVRTAKTGDKRLDETVDSAVRQVIAKNNLIDAVRTTNKPLVYESAELEKDLAARQDQITTGRRKIEKEIRDLATRGLRETYGMELVDVHIKRINYIPNVREKVYERMRSERMRVASLYESEAEEEKSRIQGQTNKELEEIRGEERRRASEIRGQADAEVIEITAKAFGQAPEFYQFLRQLEAYKNSLGRGTRLILSTDNDFLRRFHGVGGRDTNDGSRADTDSEK